MDRQFRIGADRRVELGERNAGGADHALTVKVIPNLVELYEAWNKPVKAAEWRAKLPEKAVNHFGRVVIKR